MLGHDITPIKVDNTGDFVQVLHGKDDIPVRRRATCPLLGSIRLNLTAESTRRFGRRVRNSGSRATQFAGEFSPWLFFRTRKFAGSVAIATLRITPPKR